MKRQHLLVLIALMFSISLEGQVPQGISYQSVVRNNSGAIIPNQNVSFRFSVVSGSPTGTVVYSEVHNTVTNQLGMVNLNVGQGAPVTGTFPNINWGNAAHYLSVELDPQGGSAYLAMGTTQLMSVPYALRAASAPGAMAQLTDVNVSGVVDGQVLKWNSSQAKWLPANDNSGSGGDNWGTQTVQSDNTLTGNGTSGNLLRIAQQGAANGQVLKWTGSTWAPGNDISGGSGDNWGTQVVQTDNTLTGNGTAANTLKLAQQSAANGQVLKWNGSTWAPGNDNNTDAQTLSINGTTLSISGGNSVTLPSAGGSGWSLTGNAGTNPATNFIGTTDGQPLIFKTKNTISGRISDDSNLNQVSTSFGFETLLLNTGNNNSAFGFNSMKNNTSGRRNSAFGIRSLTSNTTGIENTAIGYETLRLNTTASRNTAMGAYALSSGNSGNNTAIGYNALSVNTGSENSALGVHALQSNTQGTTNTAIGSESLVENTTGNNNTSVGSESLYNNVSGNNNTAIGYNALNSNTTGSYNTSIGSFVSTDAINRSNTVTIGGQGCLTLGGNNRVRIGNSSMSSIGGQVSWSSLSDERSKQNIAEDVVGLPFILNLRPITYNYSVTNTEAIQRKQATTPDWTGKYDIEKIRFSGFMAQQVEEAAIAAGYPFSGVDKPEDGDGLWALRYADFAVPLVKAIQEQQEMIEKLMKEIEYLKSKLN